MTGMMSEMNPMMTEMMNRPGPKGKKTMGESLQESATKYLGDPEKAVLQKLGTLTIAGRTCDDYRVERNGKYGQFSEEVCVDPTLAPPHSPNEDAEQMAAAAQG